MSDIPHPELGRKRCHFCWVPCFIPGIRCENRKKKLTSFINKCIQGSWASLRTDKSWSQWFSKLLGKSLPARASVRAHTHTPPVPPIRPSSLVSKWKSGQSRAVQMCSTRGCNRPTPSHLLSRKPWPLVIGLACVSHPDLVPQQYFSASFFSFSLFPTQEEVEQLLESGGLGLKSWLCHVLRH